MIFLNIHTQALTIALAVEIIVMFLVVFALIVWVVSYFSFDDDDPDMYWDDNFAAPQDYYGEEFRPHVAISKADCPHSGEKTDRVIWVTCTCEEIHTFCDDCGENLGIRFDC